jgi:hypothetical protein
MEEKPGWWVLTEQAFELLLRFVMVGFWLWGLGIFLLVLYGVWLLLTGSPG